MQSKADFTSAIQGRHCGYYGPNGASVIESEILAMLVPKEELSRTVYHTVQQTLRSDPRNRFDGYDAVFDFREFVTFVLTPSVATMLIQEDTGMVYSISVANAIRRATSILDGVTDVSFNSEQGRAPRATEPQAGQPRENLRAQLLYSSPATPDPTLREQNLSTSSLEMRHPTTFSAQDDRAHRNRIAAQKSRNRRKAELSYLERRGKQTMAQKNNTELRERLIALEKGWEVVVAAAQVLDANGRGGGTSLMGS
ncbi:hypothetical protein B0H14DRAFT_3543495 [Mycena olivaceomarginata]|nr:hypothetical protein B0H14DRAFT_3543495 [Mycena olivaceomarginata]